MIYNQQLKFELKTFGLLHIVTYQKETRPDQRKNNKKNVNGIKWMRSGVEQ